MPNDSIPIIRPRPKMSLAQMSDSLPEYSASSMDTSSYDPARIAELIRQLRAAGLMENMSEEDLFRSLGMQIPKK